MLDDRFTGQQSKGLFTFYREQSDYQPQTQQLNINKVQTVKQQIPNIEIKTVKKQFSSRLPIKNHLMQHSLKKENKKNRYRYKKQSELKLMEEKDLVQEIRNGQKQFKKRGIVSMNINFQYSDKNELFYKLAASKTKRSETQMQSHHQFTNKTPTHNYLNSSLQLELLEKDIFQHKNILKMNSCKRKLLQINSIVGRCINSREAESTVGSLKPEVDKKEQKAYDDKQIKIPSFQKIQQKRKVLSKLRLNNSSLYDNLITRHNKMKQLSFWQDYKLNKLKQTNSQNHKVINLNHKIDQWLKSTNSGQQPNTTIHQTLLPYYFLQYPQTQRTNK